MNKIKYQTGGQPPDSCRLAITAGGKFFCTSNFPMSCSDWLEEATEELVDILADHIDKLQEKA